ncbi:HAD family hydrolase [Oceanirhabdus sp. W0125-5]|uniref:HAD family hydrolase n=1 Tax=Oceanirhabdus sp. W0125-5 TaxID=2999116 RepID=UPI0022F2A892|nr:HAD-IA family hydrolase [Oceanirhabdus sp. W0125-5]WBW95452.1 HAD-IA family hydrolase [Oceanirhabdus sp. W0125-5]
MIKGVIFDLDDTLYNEKYFVYEGFKAVGEYLAEKYMLDYEEIYVNMMNILKKSGRGKIFNIICNKYDINEDILTLVEVYRNVKPKLELYEDAQYILKKFKGKYKLGLITDGLAKVQWNKIRSLDLEKYFDNIRVTDDLGEEFWKPNEHVFLEMIKSLNCKPEEAVYIGDNPNKDFIGARKININTIRIIRPQGDYMQLKLTEEYEADFEITSLDKLEDVFKRII